MKKNLVYYLDLNLNGEFVETKKITCSTALALREAQKLNIECTQIPGTGLFKLKKGKHVKYFKEQVAADTTYAANSTIHFKNLTRNALLYQKVSIPRGYRIALDSLNLKKQVYRKLKKPLVVKPVNGSHGDLVFMNISNLKTYQKSISAIIDSKFSKWGVLIEEMFHGKEYRILATRKKVIGVINRIPANIIGDGKHSIKKLIEIKNRDPRRGADHEKSLLQIQIDDVVKSYLKEQNLTLKNIPKKNKQIFLRQNSNLSTGGDSIDVTDIVHPSVKKIALNAINAIPGLEFAGIDFMTTDIKKQQTKDSYIVLEINSSPMFCMHDIPFQGKNRHAAFEFLKLMFPDLKNPYKDE